MVAENGDAAVTQEVGIDEFRTATRELGKAGTAMQTIADVMAKEAEANGDRSWLAKNPGVFITVVVTVCSVLIVGFQYYFQNELERGQRDFYETKTAPKVEDIETTIEIRGREAAQEHVDINKRIDAVGDLQIEQGKDHRKILKDLAEKQRIPVAGKTEDLKAAESKVMEK